MIPVGLAVCLLFLIGCSSSNTVAMNSQKIAYRSAVSPLESLPSLANQNHGIARTKEEIYVSWQVEHNNIVKNLNTNKLAFLEAHRKATGHLNSLKDYKNGRILDSYLEIYANLLEEAQRRTPTRILEKKYFILQQEIQKKLQE
ncbi:MAG: hypothetical protein HUU50_22620 [Candidatus Brocadiae bacterium]|nr:hypothetical protein [Candidatus Brocadiia bacterium]